MKTLFGLLVVGGLTLTLLGCSGDARDKQSRDAAFQELFGFPPPGDVASVQSSWRKDLSGNYIRWIRVNCGPATIATIRGQGKVWPDRFVILTVEPGYPKAKSEIPAWWGGAKVLGELDRFVLPKSTSSKLDVVYVWVDSEAGIVYASRNVVD